MVWKNSERWYVVCSKDGGKELPTMEWRKPLGSGKGKRHVLLEPPSKNAAALILILDHRVLCWSCDLWTVTWSTSQHQPKSDDLCKQSRKKEKTNRWSSYIFQEVPSMLKDLRHTNPFIFCWALVSLLITVNLATKGYVGCKQLMSLWEEVYVQGWSTVWGAL
jgi:hypothetical protein